MFRDAASKEAQQGLIGFVASTGGFLSQCSMFVRNFHFAVVSTSLAHSYILEDGLIVATAGEAAVLSLQAMDSCELPRRGGGDSWEVVFKQAGRANVDQFSDPPVIVTDKGDGSYAVSFTLPASGPWKVFVKCCLQPFPTEAHATVFIKR